MAVINTTTTTVLQDLPPGRTAGNYRYTLLLGGVTHEVQEVATPEVMFAPTEAGAYSVSLERLLDDGSVWMPAVLSNEVVFVLPRAEVPTEITITLS